MKKHMLTGVAMCALVTAMAGTAMAADAAADDAIATASVEEVVVLGRGEARQVQEVEGKEILRVIPGASPLKLVDKLPNVNLQSADPFGAYEWSTRISIRSFNQSQLGFTLDGVPLGDMTYGNHNGLHISRAISGENVGLVELSQGAGTLDTASSSNLGGVLKYQSRDPAKTFGGFAGVTAGKDNTYRGFLRLESGELPSGARGYLSYAYNTADKWKGDGKQRTQQVNFKAVQPIGEGSLTGFLNWSHRQEQDYQDMSLEMIRRLGRDWDNVSANYPLAVRIAEIAHNRGETGVTPRNPSFGTAYTPPITNVDDAYFDASGLRNDLLGGITLKMPLNETFSFSATVYGHRNEGQGLWGTPYVASPNYGVAGATTNDAPLSIRTTEYDIKRYGIVASGQLRLDTHIVTAGVWYEDNSFNQARRYYGLDRAAPQRSFLDFQSNPFRTDWEYDFQTTTYKLFIEDRWQITDQLKVNFGVASLSVENEGKTVFARVPALEKNGTIKAEKNFLPQAGASYAISEDGEVFVGYARSMRAFPSSGTSGPFSASKVGFDAIKDKLQPETADTFEGGVRFRTGDVQGVLAGYHVKFKDRLFGVAVGSAIIGNPSALANVGGVTAMGFEAVGTWKIDPHWSLFGSYAYNDSTYDEDTRDGNGVIVARTKDKVTVDTPKHIVKGELNYESDGFFARLSISRLSKRYFSYENDQSVPSQFVADIALGYTFSGSDLLDGLEAQINVTNIFDRDYVSTINSNGFGIRGDNQTLLVAPPRQVFVSVRKTF